MLFLNLFMNFDTRIIIIKDGRTTPSVENIAPIIPEFLKPMNVLILIAKGPGVDSDIAMNSRSSLLVAQEYLSMYSLIRGIIAYPPPNVKRPILKNTERSIKFIPI